MKRTWLQLSKWLTLLIVIAFILLAVFLQTVIADFMESSQNREIESGEDAAGWGAVFLLAGTAVAVIISVALFILFLFRCLAAATESRFWIFVCLVCEFNVAVLLLASPLVAILPIVYITFDLKALFSRD